MSAAAAENDNVAVVCKDDSKSQNDSQITVQESQSTDITDVVESEYKRRLKQVMTDFKASLMTVHETAMTRVHGYRCYGGGGSFVDNSTVPREVYDQVIAPLVAVRNTKLVDVTWLGEYGAIIHTPIREESTMTEQQNRDELAYQRALDELHARKPEEMVARLPGHEDQPDAAGVMIPWLRIPHTTSS